MTRTALLVTRSDDNDAVTRVAHALEHRGVKPVRVDTDRYPHDVLVSSALGGVPASNLRNGGAGRSADRERYLDVDGARIDLGDVGAVWYRRFHAGAALPAALDDEVDGTRAACVDESRRALLGMISALPCVHVDALEAVRKCDSKELQLQRAVALGLDVPRTLFSNDAGAARVFCEDNGVDEGGVVTKVQSSFAVERSGREHVVFTSVVERAHLEHLEDLRFCPMVFQQRIDKVLDVRATVVGGRVFSAALPAKDLDWRVDGAARIDAWVPHPLPRTVEHALLRLIDGLGLRYGACDFVVDGDGRHWFLEVNAGGEWLWLDDVAAPAAISGAIADELSAGGSRGRRRVSARGGTR